MKVARYLMVIAATAGIVLSMNAVVSAETPGRLVSKGNRQYHRKDYEKALDLYDKASVKAPESPIVAFNKGAAFYKKEDYDKAREQFQQAAAKTKSLPLEAKAWYNLGNCSFKEGGRQEDSDLQKALQSYEESVKHYGTALEKDPELAEAAQNLEIARLKIKDLLDKIKNQQQQGGDQNQQNQQQNQDGQQGQEQQQGENQEQQDQEKKDTRQEQQGAEEKKDQQKQQKDKNKQGQSKGQQKKELARDATAREILDEEKENRKERQREAAGGYRPVEKDW